jgi:hypothetical protein
MSKLMILGFIVVVVALVMGDVVNVSFDVGKLKELPSKLREAATNPAASTRVRTQLVQLKRSAEQMIIKDDKRKLELAALYVKGDAERLQEMLNDESTSPDVILPQAELVQKSFARFQEQASKSSPELLIETRNGTAEALARAKEAIEKLRQAEERFETIKEKLERVRTLFAEKLAQFENADDEEESDEPQKSPTPSPTSSQIPLNF